MIHSTDSQQDTNFIGTSTEVFIEYYNKNIPDTFPHATHKTLKEFQTQYPSLFKEDRKWTINKHRKKYMDWLISHSEA